MEAPPRLERGAVLRYRLRLFGWPISWRTEIEEWAAPHGFTDVQVEGPYPLWEHAHRFEDDGRGGTVMRDRVRYRVPGGPLAPLVNVVVSLWLRWIFDFRRRELARLLGEPARRG